jgi:hypothetical protein
VTESSTSRRALLTAKAKPRVFPQRTRDAKSAKDAGYSLAPGERKGDFVLRKNE